jgi:hypothetical protein
MGLYSFHMFDGILQSSRIPNILEMIWGSVETIDKRETFLDGDPEMLWSLCLQ